MNDSMMFPAQSADGPRQFNGRWVVMPLQHRQVAMPGCRSQLIKYDGLGINTETADPRRFLYYWITDNRSRTWLDHVQNGLRGIL
ncbi:hypothetical protein [Ralstonia mannitolilytica]|uniref:hypothetical protein n=1 Tax=Ralstonia mannitolilytica TaxID=105219 RepID=UPI0013DE00C3|nr:hypothetical protein [Ralstonia mannitolilytica]QIF07241.1 hypothetical protein G5A69_05735 [Ralstonia mannitolilytica]